MKEIIDFVYVVTYTPKGDRDDRRIWAAYKHRDVAEKVVGTLDKARFSNIEVEQVDYYGS